MSETVLHWIAQYGYAGLFALLMLGIVGLPNVGKSTLVNALVGEERMIASPEPGTTRDSIEIPFERAGRHYTLIDTAGLRRRGKQGADVERHLGRSIMPRFHAGFSLGTVAGALLGAAMVALGVPVTAHLVVVAVIVVGAVPAMVRRFLPDADTPGAPAATRAPPPGKPSNATPRPR